MVEQVGYLLCIVKGIDEESSIRKQENYTNTILDKVKKMRKRLVEV